MLAFEDARINTHGFSNPDEEARIILDVLSLLSATTWNVTGVRVNGIDTLGTRRRSINLETERLPGDIDVTKNVMDVLRLDAEALMQFVRASGLIHSDDSQIGRSSSSSHYESRNCRQRHASRSPPA